MGDHRDYVALDWVKGEIGETLQQAQQALEAYVENPKDTSRLRVCLTCIHQVHGTLQMVEFYGAALLAEEMEKLARAMVEGKTDSINDAQEVLMQSILQLPSYLDNVKSAQQDVPIVLLPILNDLRTARGDKPLTETSLFTPDIEKAYELSAHSDYSLGLDPNFDALTRKLRQMYQFALIGVIRQQDLEVNLGYLTKVMVRLERLCVETPIGALWWVSTGFVEALADKDIALGATTKTLLRLIDKELKGLIASGSKGVNRRPPEELLKNILYYIAKSHSDIPKISEIKQVYRLDKALPNETELVEQRQKLLGPNREAIGSVVSALVGEISVLKERLNEIVTEGVDRNSENLLGDLLPGMKQVADTMAVLGLGMPRRVVQNQIEVVGEIVAGTQNISQNTLMDVAGAFLYVEASLTGLVKKADSELATDSEIAAQNQLTTAQEAVIREARLGVEQAKQAVVSYLASNWDAAEMSQVPALLSSIRGGLKMIPMSRAANILHVCQHYVEDEILSPSFDPNLVSLELLAEVISGVEYYLERMAENGSESNDIALEMAEKSLQELGLSLDVELPEEETLEQSFNDSAFLNNSPSSDLDALINETQTDFTLSDSVQEDSTNDNNLTAFTEDLSESLPTQAEELLDSTQNSDSAQNNVVEFPTQFLSATADTDDLADEENLSFEDMEDVNALDQLLAEEKSTSLFEENQNTNDPDENLDSNLPSPSASTTSRSDGAQSDEFNLETGTLELTEDSTEIFALSSSAPEIDDTKNSQGSTLDENTSISEPIFADEHSLELTSSDSEPLIETDGVEVKDIQADPNLSLEPPYIPEVDLVSHSEQGAEPNTTSDDFDRFELQDQTDQGSGLLDALHADDQGVVFSELDGVKGSDLASSERQNTTEHSVEAVENEATDFDFDDETASIIAELDESLKRANEELETLKTNSDELSDFELSELESGAQETPSIDLASLEAENLGDAFSPAEEKQVDDIHQHTDNDFTADATSFSELSAIDVPEAEFGLSEEAEKLRGNIQHNQSFETHLPLVNEADIEHGPDSLDAFVEGQFEEPLTYDTLSAKLPESDFKALGLKESEFKEPGFKEKDLSEAEASFESLESIQNPEPFNLSDFDVHENESEFTDSFSISGDEPEELIPQEVASLDAMNFSSEEDDLIDDEIIEIFLEEADEVLESINTEFPKYYEDTFDQEALITVRRSFHTLKGSGRMVQASVIGELAWSIENMLNRILDETIEPTQSVLDIVEQTRLSLPTFINDFRESRQNLHKPQAEKMMSVAHELADGKDAEEIPLWNEEATNNLQQSLEQTTKESIEEPLDPALVLEEKNEVDPGLLDVFRGEVGNHVSVIQAFLRKARHPNGVEFSDALQRALHTLKGSAIMAELDPIADIASPMERFVKDLRSYRVEPDQESLGLIAEGLSLVEQGVDQLDDLPLKSIAGSREFIARIEATAEERVQKAIDTSDNDFDGRSDEAQLLSIFLSEGMDLLIDADSILSKWRLNPTIGEELDSLLDELRTLARGAQMADQASIAQLSLSLERAYSAVMNERIQANDIFFDTISRGHEVLINMMDQLAAGQSVAPAPELIESIDMIASQTPLMTAFQNSLNEDFDEAFELDLQDSSSDAVIAGDLITDAHHDDNQQIIELKAEEPIEQDRLQQPLPSYVSVINVLVDTGRKLAHSWNQNPSDRSAIERLQSNARAIKVIADRESVPPLTHLAGEVEMLYAVISEQELIADKALFELIGRCFDKVHEHVHRAQSNTDILFDDVLIQELQDWIEQSLDDELGSGDEFDNSAFFNSNDALPVDRFVPSSSNLNATPSYSTSTNSGSNNSNNNQLDVAASLPNYVPDSGVAQTIEDEEDAELVAVFLEESREIMESISTKVDAWRQNPDNLLVVMELQRELHTLKGGARMAELDAIGTLCHELESVYSAVQEGKIGYREEYLDLLERSHDQLNVMLEAVANGSRPAEKEADKAVNELHALLAKGPAPAIPLPGVNSAATDSVTVSTEEDEEIFDEYEAEILEIFIDEAQELIAALDQTIHDWEAEPEKLELSEELQRILHTLKGGARLSGHTEIGDLSHDFEAFLAQSLSSHPDLNQEFFQEIHRRYDLVAVRVENIQQHLNRMISGESSPSSESSHSEIIDVVPNNASEGLNGSADVVDAAESVEKQSQPLHDRDHDDVENVQNVDSVENVDSVVDSVENEIEALSETGEHESEINSNNHQAESPSLPLSPEAGEDNNPNNVVPFVRSNKVATRPPSGVTGEERVQPVKRAPAEMVKVSSSLLDSLVNLAGETSISRGLLEQQVNDFGFTLEEMDTTLERLREQLRRLDIETEAQVLFRQERSDSPEYADFDPLEMDRYSHIQQLSRSLVESASDLLDLKQTLVDKTRDAETLLLQQSRVNTELQEGLMQTRMVPFSRLVPRLRRIVRQVGNELGKKAELQIFNAEGQLDRTVLERMISPLEHMLRNAVDHGIETEEDRVAVNKESIGQVELRLSREGGDVVVRLSDDGKGIDLEAVRKKALEKGLMSEGSDISDQEVLQFILQSGFSTASEVTQISGRGVGMDVVHSEVKQLGGSMFIESTQGQGTTFTIRLPITVAVTRALMVRSGEDLYAVPLSSIEGIVRVSPLELQNQLKLANPRYTYAGHEYQIDSLSVMLGGQAKPSNVDTQARTLPVVLVRGTDRSVAFQVDTLLGSREIVVKTLGPQFASVVGVSGGTILGDGSVVIILDLPAMIRSDIAAIMHKSSQEALEASGAMLDENRLTQVLVVDDSVTVRKVTSRLLERNGMEALVAKDGVDAMALLQDHKPDVILLDIEMPRMDGFEVASQVRHDARLQNVPIIMITSRTGEKHRERALSLGVRRYMGKPFQETELMENIHALVER